MLVEVEGPLKQGLKQNIDDKINELKNQVEVEGPLKQGLKLSLGISSKLRLKVEVEGPLKQGLKHGIPLEQCSTAQKLK